MKIKFFLGSMFTPTDKLKPLEQAISSCGLPVKYKSMDQAGFYEVQLLQKKWGGSIVVFGPGLFDMAHSADEYVDISSVLKVQEVIDTFLSTNL